ncbi:protease HtpX [Sulfurimonas sediminis]|uniref:Protease HtpX homolog n=2 Tax=Sulfurimonas sediminis TaxID=2590020 RepID=A0A7M1B0Y1_9BACT|nr:protease HtpX [Sulfurimonas sediminis]
MMSLIMLIIMNLAVMASLYVALFILSSFFGIYIDQQSMSGLFMMAALFGFGGSFISLFMSKWMAIRGMGVEIIEYPNNEFERWLMSTIEKLSDEAGIGMPEVGIFDAPPNAFATGWDKNNSLVAVSTGLIESMDRSEIEGVLAHEISHVKNGDMVTMTLMQGVLNTFVIFISRLLASMVARDRNGNTNHMMYFMISMALEMVFSLFATAILMWYSRYREYRADEGAVDLSGPEGIYYALAKLGRIPKEELALNDDYRAFGIVGFLGSFFASHPPIEARLEHIQEYSRS